jgi:hypothetical protein
MQLETVETAATPTPDSDGQAPVELSNLFELLDDEPAANKSLDGGEDGAAVGNDEKGAQPEMFNDLAESLGIGLDDLYKLKVSTVDGETVTIEEMKALQSTQDNITVRELEFEETRAAKEGDLRQAQNELAEVVAGLPNGTLKPEVLEKLRAKNAARTEVEQSRTLGAIPTWNDEATRTADLVGMSSHLERFGFPTGHLASVVDHRMFVFIRESYLREQRIKNALDKVRAGKPNPTTPTKAAGKAPGKTGAAPKNSNARNGLESFLMNA